MSDHLKICMVIHFRDIDAEFDNFIDKSNIDSAHFLYNGWAPSLNFFSANATKKLILSECT